MAAMPAPSAALQPASDRINFAERGYSLAPEQAPEGWAKTAPKFSLRRPSKEAGLGVHADGSDVMVPTLQFSPRAQAEASEMSRSDFWVHGVPDVEWPPTVFWFYGETAEERAKLQSRVAARVLRAKAAERWQALGWGLRVALSRRNVLLTTAVLKQRRADRKWRRLTLNAEVHVLRQSLVAANGALARGRAAAKIQSFVRRRKLRWLWLEVIRDMLDYSALLRQLKRDRRAING